MSPVARLDRFQRRHSWLGLPLAVIYKFFDDRGAYLAALVTYYAFVSLFPLLLIFFSVLGFFLQGNSEIRRELQNAALKDLPVIGQKLSHAVATFHGSGVALAIGVIGTLYGGLGAMQAAQAGFNQIYGVPRNEQPNPLKSRVRSLGLLALLGSGVLLTTGVAVVLSTANGVSHQLGDAARVGGYIANYLIDVGLFSVAFQLLTATELRFRQVLTGGAIAAAAWMVLQVFGSGFVSGRLKRSNELYGVFAVVLATLAWLYLQSLILMLAAEVNVVLHRRLWPRALLTPFTDNVELTAADRRAYEMYARAQRFKGFEHVTTEFAPEGQDTPAPSPPPSASANGSPDPAQREADPL